MKTINVDDELWKKLTRTKLDWDCETLGEVIDRLFKNKLKEENTKIKLTCKCGYSWYYFGKNISATCPDCLRKVNVEDNGNEHKK